MTGLARTGARLAAVAVLASCGHQEAASRPPAAPVAVRVTAAAAASVPVWAQAVGSTQSYARASLSTRLMGLVSSVTAEEGQAVHKGQVLVRIESQDLAARRRQAEAALEEARAVLANAEKLAARRRNLRQENAVPQQSLDEAETGRARAAAAVANAEQAVHEVLANLEYSEVRSPLTGSLVRKLVQVGDLSAPGVPLVEVEQLDPIKVTLEVGESDLAWVSVGQEVDVEIPSLRTQPQRRGRVEGINPAANLGSRTFQVRVVVANPDGAIGSGMFARVGFPKGTRGAVMIPAAAVVRQGQLEGVFTVKGSQAILRWVRLGRAYGDRVEVLSGLDANEPVVIDGQSGLRDGAPVEVRGDA